MTDKTQYIVRQGDVLLEKQEEIPEDFTKESLNLSQKERKDVE